MAIGDVYRFSTIGDWGAGNIGLFTLHLKMITGLADPTSVCSFLQAAMNTQIKTHQTNVWYWRQVDYLKVNPAPPVAGSYTTGFPVQGSVAGDGVPNQAAAILTLRTANVGRSYRGRIYIPGMAESMATNVGPIAAAVSDVQAFGNDLVTTFGPSGTEGNWQIGVWSRKYNLLFPVTTTVARSVWGSQRRRRSGSGV